MEKEKKNKGFIVGIVIILFAVFGMFSLVNLAVTGIKDMSAKQLRDQNEKYNEILIPIAAIDIKPFDDIVHASMSELVELSVWSHLNSKLDPSAYTYSDGKIAIPAAQVEAEYIKYFGTEKPIAHTTVEGYGYEFTYDSTNKVYNIPLTTITPLYTPKVTKVEKKGESVTITCGLINSSLWSQDSKTGDMIAPEPDKYVKVTLRSMGKGMHISAIQASGTPEVASPQSNSTTVASIVPTTDAAETKPGEVAETSTKEAESTSEKESESTEE